VKTPKEFERIVSFRVDDETYRRLRAAADEDDRRLGPFLRRLVGASLRAPQAEQELARG